MKKAIGIFVFALALGVSGLSAQSSTTGSNPANFVQHRVSFLATLLSLNATEQQQATTIFTNAASADASVRFHPGRSWASPRIFLRHDGSGCNPPGCGASVEKQ
jgi:hypothetical protein